MIKHGLIVILIITSGLCSAHNDDSQQKNTSKRKLWYELVLVHVKNRVLNNEYRDLQNRFNNTTDIPEKISLHHQLSANSTAKICLETEYCNITSKIIVSADFTLTEKMRAAYDSKLEVA